MTDSSRVDLDALEAAGSVKFMTPRGPILMSLHRWEAIKAELRASRKVAWAMRLLLEMRPVDKFTNGRWPVSEAHAALSEYEALK